MSGRWFHYLWLAYLSKPRSDRSIFRLIKRQPIRSIVEIGVGDLSRAVRVIEFARQFVPNGELRYTGVDLFEARPDPETGIPFKQAHGELKRLDAKTMLLPGDPFSALARAANGLTGTDLVIIAHDTDPEAMERAWLYLPRMLHSQSVVLRELPVAGSSEEEVEFEFVPMTEAEIASSAGANAKHIARAA